MIYHGKEHMQRDEGNVFGGYSVHSDLSDLPEAVNQSIARLAPHKHQFDSIVVQGMSGVIVGAPVALALHKQLVVVRKPEDQHHNMDYVINAHRAGRRYLFLDDFIATGTTYGRVHDQLRGISEYAGRYLYLPDDLELDVTNNLGEAA